MARVRDMQGVPAQLEHLKSDGKRRHPSYCIFHEGTGKTEYVPIRSVKYTTKIAAQQKTVITMRRKSDETANL